MSSPSTSAAAVARVASLTSANVVHVAANGASPFAASLKASDSLVTIPQHADPGSHLARLAGKGGVASLLLASNQSVLTGLVPHLPALAKAGSVVIHVATDAEHADVMALRSSGLVTLYSATPTQAHDSALFAAHIAATSQLPVLHFFDNVEGAVEDEATEADVRSFAASSSRSAGTNGHANGHSNGHSNGAASSASPASRPTSADDIAAAVNATYAAVSNLVGREVAAYAKSGSASSASDAVVVLGAGADLLAQALPDTAVISVNLVRPVLDERFWAVVPSSAKRVAVLEQSARRTTKLGPLFVDVATAFQRAAEGSAVSATLVSGVLGALASEADAKQAAEAISAALEAGRGKHGFTAGPAVAPKTAAPIARAAPPKHEEAYNTMLKQLFNERLSVINSPSDESDPHPAARSPEYAFGQALAQLEQREEAVRAIKDALRAGGLSADLNSSLSQWISAKDDAAREALLPKLQSLLAADSTATLDRVRAASAQLSSRSRWIVGSDAWAYDAGMGGVHHVISSGRNVNMLIFDSLPYTKRDALDASKRKKDIGLYAMNYGNTYVASTAVYSDYTQVLHALIEADKFDGPSIVLAYIPYRTEDAPALDVLRETKLAVDSGYWPLYRWDPSAEARGAEVFRLDGVRVREALKEFLDRQNLFSNLVNARPQLSYDLAASKGTGLVERQKLKAKEAYDALLGAMDGPPLLVLYASDGGTAEKVAKKFTGRAKARGLAARILAMDDFPVADELSKEPNVVLITSTAGQGEAPQNGRVTYKALHALPEGSFKPKEAAADEAATPLRYTVFAMGDSHYWPRAEDAHYYNKAGKDYDARLEVLGAERLAPIGLGDDQDADGWQTGYKAWEPTVWKALGVDGIEVKEAEPEPITNEHIKIASNYLRGTILEGLADKSTGAIAESDGQLTKFHGTYMQYDRDTFEERKAAGLEPAYSFMIRARIAGGVVTPQQWLQLDDVATQYGNNTVKITTRQTIQYHCILKSNLKSAMQGINKSLLDTIAACGDVNRNVMCSPLPSLSQLHEEVYSFSQRISDYLLPRMNAYHEIWLDKGTDSKKELIAGGALKDYEPLYGPYYLPRKFKIAIAVPPRNDTDCFAHDIGLIAIPDKNGKLAGFNLAVGGGMGVTHSMKATYPRLGDVIGFVTPDQTLEACKQVMLTQRDTGNRKNRKQARLKYTIDNHFGGPDNFRKEVESRLGYELAPAREFKFETNTDVYGWVKDHKGQWHCGLWLENGRVADKPGDEFKTGLRELAKIHKGHFRMTPNQHIIVSDVAPEDKERIHAHLEKWGMVQWNKTKFASSASSCVALPTCGLAMAEAERAIMTDFVEPLDKHIVRLGLQDEEITARMTGCPNGCARPWLGQIALVGKAPNSYLFLLGGKRDGSRVASIYKEAVSLQEAIELTIPLLERYAAERNVGESFGDFVIRIGVVSEVKKGSEFWNSVGGVPVTTKVNLGHAIPTSG